MVPVRSQQEAIAREPRAAVAASLTASVAFRKGRRRRIDATATLQLSRDA
jgi:hypothetical protein